MSESSTVALALVTGASGGIGREVCRQMLALGYDVVLTGRRAKALDELASVLRAEFPARALHTMALDIGDLGAIQAFGCDFSRRFPRLDVLVHCAGVYYFDNEFRRAHSGLELNYATHVLGPYALTQALRESLCQTAQSRVVLVSSSEHRSAEGGPAALVPAQPGTGFSNVRVYRETKWGTLLLATALQQQFAEAGDDVAVVAAHPGLSITGIQHRGNPNRWQRGAIWLLGKLVAGPPEGGARPVVMASTQGSAGEFYGPTGFMEARGKAGLVNALPSTRDAALASELTAALGGLSASVRDRVASA